MTAFYPDPNAPNAPNSEGKAHDSEEKNDVNDNFSSENSFECEYDNWSPD